MRKERGFTLIELLIVLAILGILIGIVAMSVGDLTDMAVQRGKDAEGEVLQTAIDSYNTMDVAVGGEAAIPARAVEDVATVLVSDTVNAPFVKYLKRDSKYTWWWLAEGVSLTIGAD